MPTRENKIFSSTPRVLGHELGVGIISVEKNEFGLQAGDRCSVEPYLNCGKCIACRMGKTQLLHRYACPGSSY